MPTTRNIQAAFAGKCYPSSAKDILQNFQAALQSAPKAGRKALKAPAYIVPHIDFRVNLDIYAEVYRMLAGRRTFPELFVILGVGHRCPHEFSACSFRFNTPLGAVETDETLLRSLQGDCPFPLSLSPTTFTAEHSLEFVIIWLQAVRDLYFPGKNFQVLPVLMGGLHESLKTGHLPGSESEFYHFGHALKKHLCQKKAVTIASIDGCHVGPRFDHDFDGNLRAQKIVKKWEKKLWACCSSRDKENFFRHASEIRNAFFFDGIGGLSLLLQHFGLKANLTTQDLWYESSDQSFVTFSGGWFDKTAPSGTQ
jgi:AmmeMemoRadiSam system protein B